MREFFFNIKHKERKIITSKQNVNVNKTEPQGEEEEEEKLEQGEVDEKKRS